MCGVIGPLGCLQSLCLLITLLIWSLLLLLCYIGCHVPTLSGIGSGAPTGAEDAVVERIRGCLRNAPKKCEATKQQLWLLWGFTPLVDYCNACFALDTLALWDSTQFGDRLFEMMKVLLMRTE